jgi:hypothetical protein
MRAMFGQGTPREAASARSGLLFFVQSNSTRRVAVIPAIDGETAKLIIIIAPKTHVDSGRCGKSGRSWTAWPTAQNSRVEV